MREVPANLGIALLDHGVIGKGEARKDNPFSGVFYKSFIGMRRVKLSRDVNGSIRMADACRRSEEDRRFVFFSVCKSILYHLIGFLRRSGVKDRDSAKFCKHSGILFGLG